MTIKRMKDEKIQNIKRSLCRKIGISVDEFDRMSDAKICEMMNEKGLTRPGMWPYFDLDLARGRVTEDYRLILENGIVALV